MRPVDWSTHVAVLKDSRAGPGPGAPAGCRCGRRRAGPPRWPWPSPSPSAPSGSGTAARRGSDCSPGGAFSSGRRWTAASRRRTPPSCRRCSRSARRRPGRPRTAPGAVRRRIPGRTPDDLRDPGQLRATRGWTTGHWRRGRHWCRAAPRPIPKHDPLHYPTMRPHQPRPLASLARGLVTSPRGAPGGRVSSSFSVTLGGAVPQDTDLRCGAVGDVCRAAGGAADIHGRVRARQRGSGARSQSLSGVRRMAREQAMNPTAVNAQENASSGCSPRTTYATKCSG
jgi:hypothetical protein